MCQDFLAQPYQGYTENDQKKKKPSGWQFCGQKFLQRRMAKLVEVDRKATIAQITDGSIKKSIFIEQSNKFSVFKWLPLSLDINLLEHLWNVVKKEI